MKNICAILHVCISAEMGFMSQWREDDVQPSPSYQPRWQAGLLLVLHVSLLNTPLPPFSSTMNKKFGIFHSWKMLSVVHSVLALMKLIAFHRSNDRVNIWVMDENIFSHFIPKDIKHNCWIGANISKIIHSKLWSTYFLKFQLAVYLLWFHRSGNRV